MANSAHNPSNRRPRRATYAGIAAVVVTAATLLGIFLSRQDRASITLPSAPRRATPLAERLDQALQRSADWLSGLKGALSSPLVWLIHEGARHAGHRRLQEVADRLRKRSVSDPLGGLIGRPVQRVPGRPMPPLQGKAFLMWLLDDLAACAGGKDPSTRLQTYLAEEHTRYLLTHQLIFSAWARALRCRLPATWRKREAELATKLERELRARPAFDDLFVERLATLMMTGASHRIERRWIETVLRAQRADGSWRDPVGRGSFPYRGATIEQDLGPLHIGPLAIYVLGRYRGQQLSPSPIVL